MLLPIFVLGNPRSGTTLLRLMLNNHRNIMIPPECGFAVWFYDLYGGLPMTEISIPHFISDLRTARKIETWNLDFMQLEKYLIEKAPMSYPQLISYIYDFYGRSLGKNHTRWGDKNNFYLRHIDTIKKMFPSSRLIHIVRDGRDVACSYRALNRASIQSRYAPRLPNNISEIAQEWVANLQYAIAAFERLDWQDVYEIRYEDLVSQPTRELTKLCDFLEEPYDPDMESYYLKNQAEQQEPVEFLKWKEKTLEQTTSSQVGRYKAELTTTEITEFERIAFAWLQRYSYSF